ncbi:MAG: alpha/beta fold hydrolase [Actinomycetota bacterium]
MQSETRRIGDIAVHVQGEGPSLVLLHANGGSHHDFAAVIDALASRAKVFAIDWPGHGDSGPSHEPGACSFADLLPILLDGIDEGPYTVIGNSVGGFAALRTAARRPDLVRNVVVINPGGFTPRWPSTFLACTFFGSERVAPVAMRLLPRLYLRRKTAAVQSIRNAAVEASRDANKARVFARIWRSFTDREHDSRADASAIEVPILVFWGTRDPILPWLVDGRRAKRSMRSAQFVMLPCGHQAFAEMPEQFMGPLEEFLGWKEGAPT